VNPHNNQAFFIILRISVFAFSYILKIAPFVLFVKRTSKKEQTPFCFGVCPNLSFAFTVLRPYSVIWRQPRPPCCAARPQDVVKLAIDPNKIHLFDANDEHAILS